MIEAQASADYYLGPLDGQWQWIKGEVRGSVKSLIYGGGGEI